ncbi:DUF1476 domain-containing protein [Methylobacterium sp. ID0610]|uniref:DUF1476 domain-containing protein n=1 Tax=Methylobacterium carpenticola TaxID=3344827 RepID=UPI0036ACBB99
MLKVFEERERAAEFLFVRAEEMRFAAHCYAVRSLASYAMSKLGVDGQTSEAYARVLIADMIGNMGDDDALLERVQADLSANGVHVSLAELRVEMMRSTARTAGATGLMAAHLARRERNRPASRS